MDSRCLDENNVAERVDAFVKQVYKLSNVTFGEDIIFTMGSDFTYSNANVWCAPDKQGVSLERVWTRL